MSEFSKFNEDNYHQGQSATGEASKTTGLTNSEGIRPHANYVNKEKVGPSHVPKHINAADFKKVGVVSSTGTGICLVNLTVDNEEKATRFVKELMSRALVAEAEIE